MFGAKSYKYFLKFLMYSVCRPSLFSDDLVVASEFDVFTTAIRWIVHDMERRVKHTMRIMALIR